MRIEDLMKQVEDMSDDELREEIRRLRTTRGVVKAPKQKKIKSSEKDPFVEIAGALDSMSPDDLKTLLGMVGGEEDE